MAGALVVFFLLTRLAPGDPLAGLTEERTLSAEAVARLRARYAPDVPLPAQLASWASGVARGDFGTSIQYQRPVRDLVLERLPATLLLGGAVLLVNFTLGVWLGALQALRHGRPADHLLGIASLVAYSTPVFWLGLLLAGWFGITLRWLPVAGMTDPLRAAGGWAAATDLLRHLVLPAATLSLVTVGATMRYQRAAMLEALREPFVLAARARGLDERRVRRHAWRNALSPVVTLLGLWLPLLVVGAVFVERVFAWPGLGGLAADAAAARDYPLLMGSTTLATATVVAGGVLADLLHRWLDPRLRDG